MFQYSINSINNDNRSHNSRFILWVADLSAVVMLSSRFATMDLLSIPKEIPVGLHTILADADTPEVVVREAIYRIEATGQSVQVYSCNQAIVDIVSEPSLTAGEISGQILEFAQPSKHWAHKQDEIKTNTKEAALIAGVTLKHSSFPEVELETLRKRCEVNNWQWDKIIQRIKDSSSNSAEELARKLRLEINSWLRITDPVLQVIERSRILSSYRFRGDAFDQLCRAQKTAERTSSQPKKTLSLDEFMAIENEPLRFLVDGYCLEKSAGLLTGLPGSGKTLLGLQLAHAVATGGTFLGEQCKQAPVLFISADQPSNITQRYLSDMGISDLDNFHLVSETRVSGGWGINDLELLERWVDDLKPGLVLIDSIRTTICYPLGIEEKSEMIGHWLKEVERIVCRHGSVIWIHHDNKDKEKTGVASSSGSTAIPGNVSFQWRLERTSKDAADPNRILSMPKTRGFEPATLNLRFNSEDCYFDFLGQVGESPQTAKEKASCQERILTLLNTKPGTGFEGAEIKHFVGGEPDTVGKTLGRMVAKGIIGKRRSQTNHKAKVYYVDALVFDNTDHSPPPHSQTFVRHVTESHTQQSFPSPDMSKDNFFGSDCPLTESHTQQSFPLPDISKDNLKDKSLSGDLSGDGNPCAEPLSLSKDTLSGDERGGECPVLQDTEISTPEKPEVIVLSEPISLLQVEADGCDVGRFVGCQVQVRSLSGKVKFTGQLTHWDQKYGIVTVSTQEGEKLAHSRETFVIGCST